MFGLPQNRNIVLIGFMGTGKTEVGRLLAAALGRPFLDTDRVVEQRAGRSVSRIFSEDGEEAFRRLEMEAVAEASACRGFVIATGGGVVLRRENMERLRKAGVVVALDADPRAILARVRKAEDRPLLRGDPAGRLIRLYQERAPLYKDADLVVDTTGLSAQEVVSKILRELGNRPSEESSDVVVRLDMGPRGYDVRIGQDLLASVPTYLTGVTRGTQVAVLTHPRLEVLYGRSLIASLRAAGYDVVTIVVRPSESSKSLRTAERVYGSLVEARFERDSVLMALGGGVISDLGGFVAATYLRGIAWVALPTTLLAQVDASIGGKTAVNHPRAKNAIGAVHQPVLVVADIDTLGSLPAREMRSGLAEVVKTAVIGVPGLFGYLEENIIRVLRRDPDTIRRVVRECVAFKASVVEADESERAGRVILNYGHTVAHGIEAAAGYHGLTHGEAVAVGMTLEAKLALRLGLADRDLVERQTRLLERAGLPVRLADLCRGHPPAVAEVRAAMMHDKKVRAGRLRFVLPTSLGQVVVRDDVPDDVIDEVLAGD